MGTQLTDHITLEEMIQSHHGLDNTCPDALAGNLLKTAEKIEEARAILSAEAGKECRVRISYGYRCEAENKACGSTAHPSAHTFALAGDTIPDPTLFTLRQAWDVLRQHPTFCLDVDQLIIERGCIHIGLAVPWHDNKPRHELRLDATVAGKRTYPLFGIWQAPHA